MTTTEAQKRASAKYQKNCLVGQVNMKFSPREADMWEWLNSRGGTLSGYIKGLIRADMEANKEE